MIVRADLCTQPAVLHGGAIMGFADTLGALGPMPNLGEGAGTARTRSLLRDGLSSDQRVTRYSLV